MGMMYLNPILNFSKPRNQVKNLLNLKLLWNIYEEASNQDLLVNRPLKSEHNLKKGGKSPWSLEDPISLQKKVWGPQSTLYILYNTI